MIEWYKRHKARKIWRSMLHYYMDYGDTMDPTFAAHFVLGMDYMKKTSEGKE